MTDAAPQRITPDDATLIHVLIPSESALDFMQRVEGYKRQPTLQRLVLIDPERFDLVLGRRSFNGEWELTESRGAETLAHLPEVGFSGTITALYAQAGLA